MPGASTAKRTLPPFCSSARIESVMARVSMYSLVLFLTSCTVTIGRLPLAMIDVCCMERAMVSAIICRSVEPNWLVTVSIPRASPYVVFSCAQPAASSAASSTTVFLMGLLLAHQDETEVDRLRARRHGAHHKVGVLVEHERLPGFFLGGAHAFAVDPAEFVGDALDALAVVVQVGVDLDQVAASRA